jgi:hypothetical protein
MKYFKSEFVTDKNKLIQLMSDPKVEVKDIYGPSPMGQEFINNTGVWVVTYSVKN